MSFSEMMERIETMRNAEIEQLKKRVEGDATFALLLELQDLNWSALMYLAQVKSVTYHSGVKESSDTVVEEIKDAMASAFEGISGRAYVPAVVGTRYPDLEGQV